MSETCAIALTSETSPNKATPVKPAVPWLLNGFHRFLRPYFKRHFFALAVEREALDVVAACRGGSLIVYANHPSWWDPLVAHFLHRAFFPETAFFAPIDAAALQHYRVLAKLGFFGVELDHHAGAASFLKTSRSILDRGDAAIWMTPEGRFADSRDRDAELMPGLAHLCFRNNQAIALPVALEYVFWNERLPVCLVTLGAPLNTGDHGDWSKDEWAVRLRDNLRDAQQRLSRLAIGRSSEPFENLLAGHRGGGMIYDSFRRMKSILTKSTFKAGHGDQFQ